MAARALVVVWRLASELAKPETSALTSAAHDALGVSSEVRVAAAADSAGLDDTDVGGAVGVARLTWDDAQHRRARLICFVPQARRWLERDVAFAPDDPAAERGRTLGFLLASMLLEAGMTMAPEGESTPSRNSEPASLHAPEAKASPPSPPRAGAIAETLNRRNAGSESRDGDSGSDDASVLAFATEPKTSIGAAAQASMGGAASGYGFWLGAEHALVGSFLWVGGFGQARFGSVSEAEATTRYLSAGLDLSWFFLRPSQRSWFALRGAGSVGQVSVSHFSRDDPAPVTKSRVLPVGETVLQTGYRFTPGSALSGEVGAEFFPGITEISLHDARVAVWPVAVGILRVGVQASF